jgi:hypothetical protein
MTLLDGNIYKARMVSRSNFKKSLLTLSLIASLGCGGGGGGGGGADEFVGAARVSVRCSPKKIDSGDRTQVSINLSQVHENGIAVKIRFPIGLKYVPGSSFLMVGEREVDVSPTVNVTSDTEEMNYVVFYLTQAQFSKASQEYAGEAGTLLIQLEGRKTVTDGEIEVDPDVDDPAEDNSTEFDISSPEFISEASASISVIAQDDGSKPKR